jgi:hypothetical protein
MNSIDSVIKSKDKITFVYLKNESRTKTASGLVYARYGGDLVILARSKHLI